VLDGDPAPPKEVQPSPTFCPRFCPRLVAKWLDGSRCHIATR